MTISQNRDTARQEGRTGFTCCRIQKFIRIFSLVFSVFLLLLTGAITILKFFGGQIRNLFIEERRGVSEILYREPWLVIPLLLFVLSVFMLAKIVLVSMHEDSADETEEISLPKNENAS